MNKVLGLVITDGVGYRNFVMSLFLKEASLKFDKIIVYSGLPKDCYNFKLFSENIEVKELSVFTEGKITWFLRKLKEVAHMYLHRSYYGINDNLQRGYPKNNSPRSILIKVVYLIASVFNSEKKINLFEKFQFWSFRKHTVTKSYRKLLKEDKPDVLLFTHQRPPYLAPLLYVAKQQEIDTFSFIFSWDNLASKGRMLGCFDNYLVWSDLMKKELLHFYPLIKQENVTIIGTPQFEPYIMDEYVIEQQNFFNKFDLHPHKKIICYSCADADIGANDAIHIKSIIKYIKKEKDLKLQLLVRTSPAEDCVRFESLKKEFPEIKWNVPKWILTRDDHVELWSQRLPSIEDVIDLKSVLNYADVNVNMCSTMSLDFMLFDKPVINTVFGNEKNGLYNDQRFLNFIHYKYVIDSEAITIAINEKELHEQLSESISRPELRKENRKKLIHLEISKPLVGTSKRIVESLIGIN